MQFDEAAALARCGIAVTRRAWNGRFWIIRNDRSLLGAYMGETGLARMRAAEPSAADRAAVDWQRFVRSLPEDWEGCDNGNGRLDES